MTKYLPNGYLDFEPIFNSKIPYWFINGARGIIGKTYGSLKYAKDHDIKIMYMRRTQAQADISGNPAFSPYKSINRDDGCNIQMKAVSKYNSAILEFDDEGNILRELGYTCALSTISNIRSFDASEISCVIYDEFIPERHERPIKNEAAALFNALETIGRNRELYGKPPLKLIALSNSNDVSCPIYQELGLVGVARKMQAKGIDLWQNPKRGISILIPQHSPLHDQKAASSLYRLTAGSEFSSMALENEWLNNDFGLVASRPIGEYKALVHVGKLYLYKHKSNSGEYYCTMHPATCKHIFTDDRIELARFRAVYPWIYQAYMARNIIFEDEQCELLLREYIRA